MKAALRYVIGVVIFVVLALMEIITWPVWVFFHWLHDDETPGPGLHQTLREHYTVLTRGQV